VRSTHQSPKGACPSVRLRPRVVAAILVSAGVHAALLLCLRTVSPPRLLTIEQNVEVTVDIRDEARAVQVSEKSFPPVGVGPRRARVAPRGARQSTSLLPRPTPDEPRLDEQPPPVTGEGPGALAMRSRRGEEPEPGSASPEASASETNMASAMGRVASEMAEPDSQKADKNSSQARVARWIRDASGETNARTGDVPPVWHDIELRIQESFHPPRNVVTRASTAVVLGQQLLNTGAARTPMDAPVRPMEPPAREASLAADVMAGQVAAGQPSAWVRAEIRVEVDPDGLLRQAEITTSSGKAAFDKLAIEAVCAAIAERPILDGCRRVSPCTTHLRWAVEAALRIEPPPVMVPSDPRTGGAGSGITPLALRFSFDETSGKTRHHRAFASEVRTRVQLLSID
jgi:TonB family protein